MRLLASLVATILCWMVPAPSYSQVYYRDVDRHWSLAIPNGWSVMSKSLVEQATARARAGLGSTSNVRYACGFAPNGQDYFDYPSVLVQFIAARDKDLDSLEKQLGTLPAKMQDIVDKSPGGVIRQASLDKPLLDRQNKRLFLVGRASVEGVGELRSASVGFFGHEGMVQFSFCAREADYDQQVELFNYMVDSFAYEAGYTYREPSGWMDWLLRGLVFAVVVAIFRHWLFKKKYLTWPSIGSDRPLEKRWFEIQNEIDGTNGRDEASHALRNKLKLERHDLEVVLGDKKVAALETERAHKRAAAP